jgi:hypothetical protein
MRGEDFVLQVLKRVELQIAAPALHLAVRYPHMLRQQLEDRQAARTARQHGDCD